MYGSDQAALELPGLHQLVTMIRKIPVCMGDGEVRILDEEIPIAKNYATGKVINKKLKNYNFDIDGTLCTNTFGNYQSAEPNLERIKTVNNLYKDGHKINLFTAEEQLQE